MPKSLFSRKYDEFRELLIAARERAGMTQTQLASKLSRPQSFISKYERGERRLDIVEFLEIATVLGVDAAAFVKDLQHPQQPRKARR